MNVKSLSHHLKTIHPGPALEKTVPLKTLHAKDEIHKGKRDQIRSWI